MYQTLYRKYRPSTFDEVVGQKVIIQTLKNAIKNQKLNHAYLFTGPRGTGKTSVAKILARTINCENLKDCTPCGKCNNCLEKQSVDIVEIDAASNNGVDEIRELKSKVNLVPSIGQYKIYIIDEVHMLTTGAFNALLKTLEEPPRHVIFVLATTEPHKIPTTILSRCQRFDFKKINQEEIFKRLELIVNQEKIATDEEALKEISKLADGGLRDALSLLDQVIAYAEDQIKIEDVHEMNGTISPEQLKLFIKALIQNDIEQLFPMINQYDMQGKDFIKLTEEIILFLRNILLSQTVSTFSDSIYTDIEIDQSQIIEYIKIFNGTIQNMKYSNNPKIMFELAIIEQNQEVPKHKEKFLTQSIKETQSIESIQSSHMISDSQKNIAKTTNILTELESTRINNTLCNFNKKSLMEWKEKIQEAETILINKQYGKYASLILDGNLKAASSDHLIFVYPTSNLKYLFNQNILKVDEMLEQLYKNPIKAIATDIDNWETIKAEFNSKTKKYTYIEENSKLIENIIPNSDDEIETIFGEIVEYK